MTKEDSSIEESWSFLLMFPIFITYRILREYGYDKKYGTGVFQKLKIATKTSFLHFSDVGMLEFPQVHYISFSA